MLLDRLVAKQMELGMTDEEFAAKLDVSRALWQGTRAGRYQIGSKILSGTQRSFPELSADILIFLTGAASKKAG